MTNNKITKTEYYSKLIEAINRTTEYNILLNYIGDKINLLDYMVDIKRNQNYFFYKGYKYALCSELINGKLTDTYYKWKK